MTALFALHQKTRDTLGHRERSGVAFRFSGVGNMGTTAVVGLGNAGGLLRRRSASAVFGLLYLSSRHVCHSLVQEKRKSRWYQTLTTLFGCGMASFVMMWPEIPIWGSAEIAGEGGFRMRSDEIASADKSARVAANKGAPSVRNHV